MAHWYKKGVTYRYFNESKLQINGQLKEGIGVETKGMESRLRFAHRNFIK